MQPKSMKESLYAIVTKPPFNHELDEETGKYIDLAANNAITLAKKCVRNMKDFEGNIDIILKGEQRKGYEFGLGLGENLVKLLNN